MLMQILAFQGMNLLKLAIKSKRGRAINDSGKLIDKNFAENLAKFCLSKQAVISSVDTKEKRSRHLCPTIY